MDPVSQLGLTCDSVEGYNIGDVHRHSNTGVAHTPELLPCGYLVGDSDTINIRLKGKVCVCFSKCVYLSLQSGVYCVHGFSV